MLGRGTSLSRTIITPQRSKTNMTVLQKAPGHLWLTQVGISWFTLSLIVQSVHESRSADARGSPRGPLRFIFIALYLSNVYPWHLYCLTWKGRISSDPHTCCTNNKSRSLSLSTVFSWTIFCVFHAPNCLHRFSKVTPLERNLCWSEQRQKNKSFFCRFTIASALLPLD